MKNCIDCNKKISRKEYIRCIICAGLLRRKKIVINHCIDCNKEIKGNNRCYSCANKIRWSIKEYKEKVSKKIGIKTKGIKRPLHSLYMKMNPSNYIDGRTIKENYCIDCNKKIKYSAKRCVSCSKSGNLSPHWRGGTKNLRSMIYSLLEYKQWRMKVFKKDNYTCQECGQIREYLEVHHDKKAFSKILSEFFSHYSQFSPIEDKETLVRLAITWKDFWNIDNGKTLCRKCHQKTYNYCRSYINA